MLMDFRLACRSLLSQPVLAFTVVTTIAVAVAANTALFSVFDGLLFRPLPYRDADRLVGIRLPTDPPLSAADRRETIEALAATPLLTEHASERPTALFGAEGVDQISDWGLRVSLVTPSLFPLTGTDPILGRTLTNDDLRGRPRRVVLGHDLWRARFGADPGVVGRVVDLPGMLGRERLIVVGVMPAGFDFPGGTNLWVGLPGSPAPDLRAHYARLATGVSVDQLRAR